MWPGTNYNVTFVDNQFLDTIHPLSPLLSDEYKTELKLSMITPTTGVRYLKEVDDPRAERQEMADKFSKLMAAVSSRPNVSSYDENYLKDYLESTYPGF